MADGQWPGHLNTAQRGYGHASRPSLTTNASGIPESVLSYASTEQVHASEFPRPPSTIPSSPATSSFSPGMSSSSYPYSPNGYKADSSQPLMPRRPSQSGNGGPASPPAYSPSPLSPQGTFSPPAGAGSHHSFGPRALPSRPTSRHVSSHRLHAAPTLPEDQVVNYTRDGYPGSTMSFDSRAADYHETRTLSSDIISTSFITSLISSTSHRSDPQPQRGNESIRSQLTYPPPRPVHTPFSDARSPPSAFAGYQEMGRGSSSMEHGVVPIGLHGQHRDSYQSSAADTSFGYPAASVTSRTPLQETYADPNVVASFNNVDSLPAATARPQRKSVSRYAEARQSMHSVRTTKSATGSFISRMAESIRTPWRRAKPLPPVPTLPNLSVAHAQQHRQVEEALPLPALANRAGELAQMLEKGYQPHQSVYDLQDAERAIMMAEARNAAIDQNQRQHQQPEEFTRTVEYSYTHPGGMLGVIPTQSEEKAPVKTKTQRRKWVAPAWWRGPIKVVVLITTLVIIVAIIVAAVVASVLSKKKVHRCDIGLSGADCALNSTCVCTGPQGNCMPLAQNLVTLTPTMGPLFGANYTTAEVALSLWETLGNPSGLDCSSQAVLVDVAPALPPGLYPNRTSWAQSTLLWSIVKSQNTTGVASMRNFLRSANWPDLKTDGAVSTAGDAFKLTALGYQFDFAAQTVTEPKQSFATAGQASSDQLSRVNDLAEGVLDKMWTHAVAASTQQSFALRKYWQSTLQQDPANLPRFLSAIFSAPILLPFDASTTQVAAQLGNSTTTPFPPPLACYPGLSKDALSRVNALETSVFGLDGASTQTTFQQSCYPNRPVYGILDLLQLRKPFLNTRTGVAQQAVILGRDTAPRVVVYSGEALSALPNATDAPPSYSYTTDPRQYGTLANMNHVLLKWFHAINDVNAATAVVEFVLSGSVVPPTNSSVAFQRLSSIPPLEVAVFGSVLPADAANVASAFGTPSGALWFGSDAALALRQWTINVAGKAVIWTMNATSPLVVHDSSIDDPDFMLVWKPAQFFLENNKPVNVQNVTDSFTSLHKFTPV